jgi:hypothetical protein
MGISLGGVESAYSLLIERYFGEDRRLDDVFGFLQFLV